LNHIILYLQNTRHYSFGSKFNSQSVEDAEFSVHKLKLSYNWQYGVVAFLGSRYSIVCQEIACFSTETWCSVFCLCYPTTVSCLELYEFWSISAVHIHFYVTFTCPEYPQRYTTEIPTQ